MEKPLAAASNVQPPAYAPQALNAAQAGTRVATFAGHGLRHILQGEICLCCRTLMKPLPPLPA